MSKKRKNKIKGRNKWEEKGKGEGKRDWRDRIKEILKGRKSKIIIYRKRRGNNKAGGGGRVGGKREKHKG